MRKAVLTALVIVCTSFRFAEAGTVIFAWNPNAESDLGGYLLSYGTQSGQYTTTIDVGNVTSYQFLEPDPSIQYYVALRAYNTSGATSPYSNEVVTTPTTRLTITSLSSNRPSPQPVGTAIVFSATTNSAVAPPQFKWWIDNGTTSTIGQQWSTSNTFTWTPTSPSSTYAIRVWARNATSTADAPDNPAAILMMTFNITGDVPNQAPTVNAGPDGTVTLPGTRMLSGTVSDDGKPTPPETVTLTWTRVSGPGTVTFSSPNAASTTTTFSTSGTYVLRLTASDGALSSSDEVTVTVNPAPASNVAPTVSAGDNWNINLPSGVTLTGTASDDGQPTPPGTLSLSWTSVSGPGTVAFATPNAVSTMATFSTPGTYVLRLTASDGALSTSDEVTVTVNPASGGGETGTGLIGQYFNDPGQGVYFTSLVQTRADATVNFDWAQGSPAPGVQRDHFSVRWTGQVLASTTGSYRFATTSDGGVRVSVDGQPVIDNWPDRGGKVNSSPAITLTAGQRYDIRVEFYDRGGRAQIQLRWTPPGQPESLIPVTQLFP